MLRRNVFIILLAIAATASAQTQIKSGFNLFSNDDDVTIGRQSAVQAEQQLQIVNDSQVNAYINRIGQQLARNAGGPKFTYTFKVVKDDNINAFALPGGWVYINAGTINSAKNDGEVAGVIAHEISHVSLRHGTQQASKAYLAQAGFDALAGFLAGRVGENTANAIEAVGGFGLNTLFLKYSRDFESQADVRGSQILAASSYSPADMISFFKTMESIDTSKKTDWLSDHPAPPDRIARIEKEQQLLKITTTTKRDYAELNRVKARLGGTTTTGQGTLADILGNIFGTPQQPAATTAANYTNYTNSSGFYRLSYPSDWEIYNAGAKGVTIVSPDGEETLLINHYEPFDNEAIGEVTLQAATQDLVSAIRKQSPYLNLVSRTAQTTRVAGGSALSVALRGTEPSTGKLQRVTLVTRQLPDEHLIYLLLVAPESQASTYSRVLNNVVTSLRIDTAREP